MTAVPLQVLRIESVEAFAAMIDELLDRDPAGYTVLGTVLDDVGAGRAHFTPMMWWAVVDSGRVVGAAMMAGSNPVWLGSMPGPAACALVDAVASSGHPVTGISGELAAVEAAADRWRELRAHDPLVRSRSTRLYRLSLLTPPRDVPGSARTATPDDLDLLVDWYWAFSIEVGGNRPRAEQEQTARSRLAQGRTTLWEVAGGSVAMAARTPAVRGIPRIGPVYTPPEHRRRGFGSAVTAAATRAALADGTGEVVLFTDLANPTSNSIYQTLGYQPVADYVEMARA